VPGQYVVLGTDGFGRSDSRAELRRFFEVNRHYVVVAALKALADEQKIDMQTVVQAMASFGIDPEKPNPLSV
jgi:pyruvate dehydrogenase E1 component